METTGKNRWQVWLSALAIFALGCVAGALMLNLYQTRIAHGSRRQEGPPPFLRLEGLKERLKLSDEQAAEVEKILDSARAQLSELRKSSEPKFAEMRKQTDAQLQQVFTEEQWQQFQAMKNEFREHRGERRRGRRGAEDSH
jgi:Spy/CpxP family protein refolding chaperone